MKLKRMIMVEGIVALATLAIVVFAVNLTPYLESSSQKTAIGMYNSREYGNGNITIEQGERVAGLKFNYTTFDPAILTIEIAVQNCRTPGNISIACNGKTFGAVFASADNMQISLTAVTFSGAEWVEPLYIYSRIKGNQIAFTSEQGTGFEGTFTYQVSIRGSR